MVGYVYCRNRYRAMNMHKKNYYEDFFLRIQDKEWISELPKTEIPYRVRIIFQKEDWGRVGYIYHKLRHPFGYPESLGIERLDKFRYIDDLGHPIFDILGVKFFYIDKKASVFLKDNKKVNDSVFLNQDVMPLVYIADRVKLFKDDAELLGAVYKGKDEMKNVVYFSRENIGDDANLFSNLLNTKQPIDSIAKFTSIVYKSNKVEFSINSPRDAIIILSEPWLPPWQASVDGKRTKIYQAYGIIQAILIPKGSHFVRFEYTFPVYLIFVSVISQIAILFFSILIFIKNKIPTPLKVF